LIVTVILPISVTTPSLLFADLMMEANRVAANLDRPIYATAPIDPIYDYAHGSGPSEGFAVTGGYVFRGPLAALQGMYFFAPIFRIAAFGRCNMMAPIHRTLTEPTSQISSTGLP
jgi:hypothetical protein